MLNERRTQYRYSTYSRQQQKVSPRSKGASELSLFHAPSLSHSSGSLFRGEWERARDPHEPKSCQRGELREKKHSKGEKESTRATGRESWRTKERQPTQKRHEVCFSFSSHFHLLLCLVFTFHLCCQASFSLKEESQENNDEGEVMRVEKRDGD